MNGLTHYQIVGTTTNGTSIEICYQTGFIPFVNGYFGECAPSEKVSYNNQSINLTKGFWERGGQTSDGKQIFTFVLCSDGINYNPETENFNGIGDIVLFSVFSIDDELQEIKTYQYSESNPFEPDRGIINNIRLAFDFNTGTQTGETISNPMEHGDQLKIRKICDRFYIQFNRIENFTGTGKCFSGNLIEIN